MQFETSILQEIDYRLHMPMVQDKYTHMYEFWKYVHVYSANDVVGRGFLSAYNEPVQNCRCAHGSDTGWGESSARNHVCRANWSTTDLVGTKNIERQHRQIPLSVADWICQLTKWLADRIFGPSKRWFGLLVQNVQLVGKPSCHLDIATIPAQRRLAELFFRPTKWFAEQNAPLFLLIMQSWFFFNFWIKLKNY